AMNEPRAPGESSFAWLLAKERRRRGKPPAPSARVSYYHHRPISLIIAGVINTGENRTLRVKRSSTGRYHVTATLDERVRAFVPAPLPPEPAVELGPDSQRRLERALLACGRLDAITTLLPDPDLFLYAYV